MTDPLIVVEGTLRLPSLRPLADRPLTFGKDWLLAGSRPIRSRSEVSLYAARLITAYVKAFALSDMRSPYQAVSIWGVMTERLPKQIFERRLEPAFAQPENAATGNAAKQDTINLKVNAPVEVERTRGSRFPTSAKTAIALACAALVAWLMLGHEKRTADEPVLIAKEADTARAPELQTPASTPVSMAAQPQAASPASVATVATVAAAATVPAAATKQPASAPQVASVKAVATPLNTSVSRSGVVQKAAAADAKSRNLTPRQKAKLKREAQRLAAAEKRANASRTVVAQQAPGKHTKTQGANPVVSRVAQKDWDDAPISTPARIAPTRLDAESLYPAPVQSARASQKDGNSAPGAPRAPKNRSQLDAATLYPAPVRSTPAYAQGDLDIAPSSPRAPIRTRSDAAALYPAPARSTSAQSDWDTAPSSPRAPSQTRSDAATLYPSPTRSTSAQSDWDNAPSSPRAPTRTRSDAATLYPTPTRSTSAQSDLDSAPSSLRAPSRTRSDAAALYPTPARSYATQADRYSAPSYANTPAARSNIDNSYVPSARSAVPEALAASATSGYVRTLRSSARYASPATKTNDSLDVKSLYDMLQHSPTLDDNVNVPARAGSKASAK